MLWAPTAASTRHSEQFCGTRPGLHREALRLLQQGEPGSQRGAAMPGRLFHRGAVDARQVIGSLGPRRGSDARPVIGSLGPQRGAVMPGRLSQEREPGADAVFPDLFCQGPGIAGMPFKPFPEYRGVVFVDGVDKLVKYHVIDQVGRQPHEEKAQIDIVYGRTASPACPAAADGDPPVSEAVKPGQLGSAGRKVCQCFLPEMLFGGTGFAVIQGLPVGLFVQACLVELLPDPPGMLQKKRLRIPVGGMPGQGDPDPSPRLYGKGEPPCTAAFYKIHLSDKRICFYLCAHFSILQTRRT